MACQNTERSASGISSVAGDGRAPGQRVDFLQLYLPVSTTATLFTPLQARYSRRSGVATMLRTVPPPEGICLTAKVSDFGSNLTSVFGVTPDSLYQTAPSVVAIP